MQKIKKANEETTEEKEVKTRKQYTKKEESFFESLSKNTLVRQLGRTLTREITRGLLGVLGVK